MAVRLQDVPGRLQAVLVALHLGFPKKCHGDGEMVSLYQFIPVYTSRNQMIFDFITMVYWVLKTTGVVASAHVHNPVLGLDPCEDVKRFMQDNGWLQVFPS